jgi:hypothetical protein
MIERLWRHFSMSCQDHYGAVKVTTFRTLLGTSVRAKTFSHNLFIFTPSSSRMFMLDLCVHAQAAKMYIVT